MIWDVIRTHPDTVIAILTFAAGLLGVDRWRKNVRAATAAEIDRWTNVAMAAVRMAINSGLITTHGAAEVMLLNRVTRLAGAVGIRIGPEHEPRILAVAQEQLVLEGQYKFLDELQKLKQPADELYEAIERRERARAAKKARTKETR